MRAYRIFQVLGLTIWAVFAGFLWYRIHHPPPSAVSKALTNLKVSENAEYVGIFLKGERVGYSSASIVPYGPVRLMQESSYLRMPMGGALSEVVMENYLTLDTAWKVINFQFTLTSGEYETDVQGTVHSGNVDLKIKLGNRTVSQSIPIDGPIYSPTSLSRMLAARNWPIDTLRLPSYDPMTLSRNEMTAWAERLPNGHRRMHIAIANSSSEQEVDSMGRLILETSPTGMELRGMTRAEALAFMDTKPSEDFDLLRMFAVEPTGKDLGDARAVVYMKIEVEGLLPEGLDLEDGNQRILSRDPLILEIGPENPGARWNGDSALLQPTRMVQSQDLRIIRKATEICKGRHQADYQRALLLNHWVHEHMNRKYTISIPSAVDVLERLEGDCNEHTVLLVALARSIGIPAQMNAGLVCVDGRFYYHAWPTLALSSILIPMDPTFGQDHVDATHIKLIAGELDRQVELMRVLGKVKIKVLDVRWRQTS
jgi:hypothetical protein